MAQDLAEAVIARLMDETTVPCVPGRGGTSVAPLGLVLAGCRGPWAYAAGLRSFATSWLGPRGSAVESRTPWIARGWLRLLRVGALHVILTSIGTDGDVIPYVALGATLRERGHRVTLVASEDYAATAAEHGLGFAALFSRAEN